MRHRRLREDVVSAARRLSEIGLLPVTSGNVSARTPEGEVLITPSGLDYEGLEAGDLVLVNLEGEVLEATLEPSTEVPMHTGIYRAKPGVGAVVHTHAPFSTALSCLAQEIPPVHYLLAALSEEGRIPIAPYTTYGTEELAENASETLGDAHSACLLQNHGTITVGKTVAEVRSRTEILENIAEVFWRAKSVGEPFLLSQEQISETRAKFIRHALYRSD